MISYDTKWNAFSPHSFVECFLYYWLKNIFGVPAYTREIAHKKVKWHVLEITSLPILSDSHVLGSAVSPDHPVHPTAFRSARDKTGIDLRARSRIEVGINLKNRGRNRREGSRTSLNRRAMVRNDSGCPIEGYSLSLSLSLAFPQSRWKNTVAAIDCADYLAHFYGSVWPRARVCAHFVPFSFYRISTSSHAHRGCWPAGYLSGPVRDTLFPLRRSDGVINHRPLCSVELENIEPGSAQPRARTPLFPFSRAHRRSQLTRTFGDHYQSCSPFEFELQRSCVYFAGAITASDS